MKYKFRNKKCVLEQDIVEWLSLLKLIEERGFKVIGDYSPTWALLNMKQGPKPKDSNQVMRTEDIQEIVRALEELLKETSQNSDSSDVTHHESFRGEMVEVAGENLQMAIFLGLLDGTAYFCTVLNTLSYFGRGNAGKIRRLIQFLKAGEATIDWTPIIDPVHDKNYLDL